MPEYVRAYIVVLGISVAVFYVARDSAVALIGRRDFARWRNLWLALMTIGFLVGDFWIVIALSATLILATEPREPVKPALFLLLLGILPMIGEDITGFGLVNYIFKVTFPVLLSLVILLPALIAAGKVRRFGVVAPDRILLAYYLLVVLLFLRETTLTDTLRQAFMLFVTMLLPYFAFSRTIKTANDVHRVMTAFVLSMTVLSAIGVFELARHWHLYASLPQHWGISRGSGYLERAGMLRAYVTGSGPIVFGYMAMIALGFLLPLAGNRLSRRQQRLGFGALGAGLLSSLSRGPWVGAVGLFATYVATGPSAFKRLARWGFIVIVLFTVFAATPPGRKFIDLLPFIGTVESGNITYRERLFKNASVVIKRNPVLGSVNYLETPEMRDLVQGQGIVDVVNTYIGVALETGLVGLGLFGGFFLSVLLALRRAIKALSGDEGDEAEQLRTTGRALFATLVAILLTIATVSSVGQIPILYWTVAGLCVAQTRIIRRRLVEIRDGPASTKGAAS